MHMFMSKSVCECKTVRGKEADGKTRAWSKSLLSSWLLAVQKYLSPGSETTVQRGWNKSIGRYGHTVGEGLPRFGTF